MKENLKSCFCSNKEVLAVVREIDPAKNPLYNMKDDVGTGRLFADVYGGICRYNATSKEYIVYDGTRWKPDTGNMVTEQMAKRLQRCLYIYSADADRDFQNFVVKLGKRYARWTMIQDARDYRFITSDQLDVDGNLLNCKNGTLDLTTFELKPHNPEDLLTKRTNCDFIPDARSDLWDGFIDDIMQQNAEKTEYLQRICGYGLLGECPEDEFYLLYGKTTRNGKSTFLGAIDNALGDYAAIMTPDALAERQRNSSAPSEEIADLQGRRFIHVEEPSKQMILDAGLVKSLTGHTKIRARRLHENGIEFDPVFKIYMAANYLPTVTDSTLFDSDRVKVCTFDRHFKPEERDSSLKKKFKTKKNASAILAWMVDGLKRYRQQGTKPPECVVAASNEYRDSSDKLGSFILDCLRETDSSEACVPAGDVYSRYDKWCGENGYHCENKKNFFEGLKRKGLFKDTGTIAGKTVRNVVRGFEIIPDFSQIPFK